MTDDNKDDAQQPPLTQAEKDKIALEKSNKSWLEAIRDEAKRDPAGDKTPTNPSNIMDRVFKNK